MTAPAVVVHHDRALLAEAAAARLVARLVDLRAGGMPVHVALTGGGLGTEVLRALADNPARDAVNWAGVHLWWGDERYLPPGHPDRNETQARQALLDRVPLPGVQIHPMPAGDAAAGAQVDAAAATYARELARYADPASTIPVPAFDVLLLGLGPDAHVASLFPGHPGAQVSDGTVIAVREAPKPPPTRISLTLPAIRAAQEVWLIAAGAEKSAAVSRALRAPGTAVETRPGTAAAVAPPVPAALALGRRRTLWLLDTAAAADLEPQLLRPPGG
jgi:6-phosphogluconolactonase